VIGEICEQEGLKHFWIELNGANEALLTNEDTLKYLKQRLGELYNLLCSQSEKALLHCSAGMHRTGTMSYTLLRLNNKLTSEQAYLKLKDIREDTYNGVSDWRIKLAEDLLVPDLLEIAKTNSFPE